MSPGPADDDERLTREMRALDESVAELRRIGSRPGAQRADSTGVSLVKSAMAYFGGAGMLRRPSVTVRMDGVAWAITVSVFAGCVGLGVLGGWLWRTRATGSALTTHLVFGVVVGFVLTSVVGAGLFPRLVRRSQLRNGQSSTRGHAGA